MEDLSDVLKRALKSMNEKKGTKLETVNIREQVQDIRKKQRETIADNRRQIPKFQTPYRTPVHEKKKMNKEKKDNKRSQLLAQWKADKEKKKELENKKTKPIFKVCHISKPIGLPNLETVNKQIKGKIIKKLAPDNYEFKAPKNIKAINFITDNSKNVKIDKNDVIFKSPQMLTRLQKKKLEQSKQNKQITDENVKELKKRNVINKRNTNKRKILKRQSSVDSLKNVINETIFKTNTVSLSKPVVLTENDLNYIVNTKTPESKKKLSKVKHEISSTDLHSTICTTEKTPKKIKSNVTNYVSPFVTISRGKDSARKEYYNRKSQNGFSPLAPESTKFEAGVNYFINKVNDERKRINELCKQWKTLMETNDLPDGASDLINTAIGQSNLLLTKKFVQFENLIERCETFTTTGIKDKSFRITCEDLHGYWDVACMQVDNIDKRFNYLEELRANNWEEIMPDKKIIKRVKNKIKKNIKSSTTTSTSSVKNFIKQARQKNHNINNNNKLSDNYLSDFKNVDKKRISSPGLSMIRASQIGKKAQTPAKSILKTYPSKTTTKKVLFKDNQKEILSKSLTLPKNCSNHERRSARIQFNSRTKLIF